LCGIDPDLRQLLSQHHPAPLGDGLTEQLRAIRAR